MIRDVKGVANSYVARQEDVALLRGLNISRTAAMVNSI